MVYSCIIKLQTIAKADSCKLYPSRSQCVWIQPASLSLSPSLSSSLLCSAYNCLANLACSSTPYQNTVVYPVVCVCACVCELSPAQWLAKPQPTPSRTIPLCLYISLCVCMNAYGCVFVKLVLARSEQHFQ